MEKDVKILVLFDLYSGVLSNAQFECMDLYYNQDLSLSEISFHIGKTRQGVHDLIKRSEAILLKMENSLNFFERFTKISENLEKISNLASQIKDFSSKNSLYDIKEKAEEIESISKNLSYKI